MPLPNDASAEEVAAALGLTDGEIATLSPRARRLTKGDMLGLLGAATDEQAVMAFILTGGAATLPRPRRTEALDNLTISDRATLGEAFGRFQVELAGNVRMRTGASLDELAIQIQIQCSGSICCCCCPCTCCCAVSVAKPARIA